MFGVCVCVCVCVCVYIFVYLHHFYQYYMCVSQEEPSLIDSNQQIHDLQVNNI